MGTVTLTYIYIIQNKTKTELNYTLNVSYTLGQWQRDGGREEGGQPPIKY